MKKVGIVTFHKAHNYGAVLQAYALQKQIEKLGHQVKFYNYSPDWIIDHYLLFPKLQNEPLLAKAKRFVGHCLDIKRRTSRYNGFNGFISEYLNEWSDIELAELDCVVIGSDQVWNPNITGGFDEQCFGKLSLNSEFNVVTYAASMESINLNSALSKEFLKLLGNIDWLGVREDSLKKYIESNGVNNPVHHNLDPTLLLSEADWDKVVKNRNTAEPYLLVYENYKDVRTRDIAEEIAKGRGLVIKTITAGASWRDSKEVQSDADPKDFLELFSNASFVVTTSYHGLAFAINYNVPFISVKVTNGVNNRATSLLKALGLSDYMINSDDFSISNYEEIDYRVVNQKLDRLREESVGFLQHAIEVDL